ncbi:hypothetical protein RCL1_002661 [Eukaryota sp. TZLM3-RCL]
MDYSRHVFRSEDENRYYLETSKWLESLLNINFHNADWLVECRDGRLLCNLINLISPGMIKRVHISKMAFKCFENIQNFVKAALALGVNKSLAFEPVDLYELRNRRRVIFCVYELVSRFKKDINNEKTTDLNVESPLLACESENTEKEVEDEKKDVIILENQREIDQNEILENQFLNSDLEHNESITSEQGNLSCHLQTPFSPSRQNTPTPESSTLPPIPPLEQLEAIFLEVIESLMIKDAQREHMLSLSPPNKWAIILQNRSLDQISKSSNRLENRPEFFASSLLKDLSLKHVQALRVTLSGAEQNWLQDFLVNFDGLRAISKSLATVNDVLNNLSINTDLIGSLTLQLELLFCLRALVNSSYSTRAVIVDSNVISNILKSLHSPLFSNLELLTESRDEMIEGQNSMIMILVQSRSTALEILTAVCCFSSAGFSTVIDVVSSIENAWDWSVLSSLLSYSNIDLQSSVLLFLNTFLSKIEPITTRIEVRNNIFKCIGELIKNLANTNTSLSDYAQCLLDSELDDVADDVAVTDTCHEDSESDPEKEIIEEFIPVKTPRVTPKFSDHVINVDEELSILLATENHEEFCSTFVDGDFIENSNYTLFKQVLDSSSYIYNNDDVITTNDDVSPFEIPGPEIPSNYNSLSNLLNSDLFIKAVFPGNIKQTVSCKSTDLLKNVVDNLWKKYFKTNPEHPIDKSKFLPKISGMSEFLYGDSPLFHYPFIFETLQKSPSIVDVSFVPITEFSTWHSLHAKSNDEDPEQIFNRLLQTPIKFDCDDDFLSVSQVQAPLRFSLKGVSNVLPDSSRLLKNLSKMKSNSDIYQSNLFLFATSSVVAGDKNLSPINFHVHRPVQIQSEFVPFSDEIIEVYHSVSSLPLGSKLVLNFFSTTKIPEDLIEIGLNYEDENIVINPLHPVTTNLDDFSTGFSTDQSNIDLFYANANSSLRVFLPLAKTVLTSVAPQPTRSFVYKQKKHAPPPFAPRTIKFDGISAAPVFSISIPLFDGFGELIEGQKSIHLWTDSVADHVKSSYPAPPRIFHGTDIPSPVLFIEFDSFKSPVRHVAPRVLKDILYPHCQRVLEADKEKLTPFIGVIPTDDLNNLMKFLNSPLLDSPSIVNCKLLWNYRSYPQVKSHPSFLAKLLTTVDLSSRVHYDVVVSTVNERLNNSNTDVDYYELLSLLCDDVVVPEVRSFASQIIFSHASDSFLVDVMLQLVSALKYEQHDFNCLSLGLIVRALLSPFYLGHYLYWYLKADLHDLKVRSRFGLYLLIFLSYTSSNCRLFLRKQLHVVESLMSIADLVRSAPKSSRLEVLRSNLIEVQNCSKWPSKFALPISPTLELCRISVEKCKVMDTKKCPLWLTFHNSDASESEVSIIFKKEDDMRQDVLVLQLFNLFDRLWRANGLLLEMSLYKAIGCGKWVGMVEVVQSSLTTAQIQKKFSNRIKFNQAFDKHIVDLFLKQKNPTPQLLHTATLNFAKSLAAYCVATFVLGIGDRHSDNVMISKSGRLFHIDFGHILGNYKYFHGIPRETAPFVFTPDFAFALGYYNKGNDNHYFQLFKDLAISAFKVLRKHIGVPITALRLMIHSGLPELMSKLDVQWVVSSSMLDSNEEEVEVKFEKLIVQSLNTFTTQFNNAMHLLAH